MIREGHDPLAEKRRRNETPTFEAYSRGLYDRIRHQWRNPKHQAQWLSTMQTYVFPKIGRLKIDEVGGADIRRVLEPIWIEKAETARRVKQRIGVVFKSAKAEGFYKNANPVDGIEVALGKARAPVKHVKSLPYAELPAFYQEIDGHMGVLPAAAFKLLILTVARTGDVIFARPEEFDLENAVWTIPGSRHKTNKDFAIPLSTPAIEVTRLALSLHECEEFLFRGPDNCRPLSNGAFAAAMKRMKVDAKPHGFRSTFRVWAEETTACPHEVKEKVLSHTIRNKVEAAYQRSDLLEKRRDVMAEWASYVEGENGAS